MNLSLVNRVEVLEPRWHDRVILPKCSKFVMGKYYVHSTSLKKYPIEMKHGRSGSYLVYVIPLDDLQTVQEVIEINKDVKEMFDV